MFAPEAYKSDVWVNGTLKPWVRHPDHSDERMHRPFIMWDGEGYTDEYGSHHYWLLANSVGDKIIAPPGRSLERYNIARIFMETAATYPNAIHVGFAFGYDSTCILRSNGFQGREAKTLKEKLYLNANGYIWKIRPGKELVIHDAGTDKGDYFRLYDVWGFFQRSFIKALNEYFPDGWDHREVITQMKTLRGAFDREHDAEVIQYNDYELELGVQLMEELRDRLFAANLLISQWYGPGAVASKLLTKWKIKNKQVDLYSTNQCVADAAQHAYAGGRFELLKCGHVNGPVYQYDINSAYPWGIAQLPDWVTGEWIHHYGGNVHELTEYSMARIKWNNTNCLAKSADIRPCTDISLYPESIPFPFWRRDKNKNISYPSEHIYGWYWAPEINAAKRYLDSLPDPYDKTIEVLEWWEYRDDGSRPLAEVVDLYNLRQKLKAKNNGAHVAIKLGLNSLYGKFAQQVGWTEDAGRKPPFHNLAAAGYVTAKCRAKMLDGIACDPTAIIATETDGIFSTRKLALPCSPALGDWEYTEYDDMWYWASGFRFGIRAGEVVKPATRGIPLADISLQVIRESIVDMHSTLTVKTNQFITLGLALHRNKPETAGQWVNGTKEMTLMCEDLQGKRIHEPGCPSCSVYLSEDKPRKYDWDELHLTYPAPNLEYIMSEPHKVLWSSLANENRDIWEHEEDGLDY